VGNIVDPDRPQMTIWRMRIGYWIPKAQTHSEYEILVLIFFTPLQQLLLERASMLPYTYITCLVSYEVEKNKHA
jgi:hypothetical protein